MTFVNEDGVLVVVPEPPCRCCTCHKVRETRPCGPDGAEQCAECNRADPDGRARFLAYMARLTGGNLRRD